MMTEPNWSYRQQGADCRIIRLRWGWVFLERARILSGIQFTIHFIDFSVVEAKRFVGSRGDMG